MALEQLTNVYADKQENASDRLEELQSSDF